MRAAGSGKIWTGLILGVKRFGPDHRSTGSEIDFARPVRLGKRRCGDHLAGQAIENVEETVLVCLHDDLASLSVDADVGQRELLHTVEVHESSGTN
jgi:hypothetical protein